MRYDMDHGIQTQLENKEIEEYIRLVLNEKEMMLKEHNRLSDSNSDR
jgi:hypothetical protein